MTIGDKVLATLAFVGLVVFFLGMTIDLCSSRDSVTGVVATASAVVGGLVAVVTAVVCVIVSIWSAP